MSLEYNPAEVQKAKNFISDLQGKISKIEEALHRLQSAKERVEARLAKQVSFIAPVNRLPSELLLVVFKLASDVYDLPAGYLLHEETQLSFDSNAMSPWSPSAVCQRWRTVSLSHPPLWTRLEYSIIDRPGWRLTLQLERTHALPLHLRLVFYEHPWHNVWDTLSAYTHRILELDITMAIYAQLRELPLNVGLLTTLERLMIRAQKKIRADTTFFQDAHNLKDLSLESLLVDNAFPTLVPWAGITSLNLEKYVVLHSISPILQVLRITSHLSLLNISPDVAPNRRIDAGLASESFDKVSLPRLKSFQISFRHDRSATHLLLDHLLAPVMKRFKVISVDLSDLQAIHEFIRASSSPPITTLSIIDSNPDTEQDRFSISLHQLFLLLPSLLRMQLDASQHRADFDSAVRALTVPEQSSCPELQALHITGEKALVLANILRAFAQKRQMASPVALQKIHLDDSVFKHTEWKWEQEHQRRTRNSEQINPGDEAVQWTIDARRAGLLCVGPPPDLWEESDT